MAGWSIPPTRFVQVIEQDLVKHMQNIVKAMHGEVISRAPVDTGLFRANNIVSVGAPVFSTTTALDRDGGPTRAAGISALSALKPYTVVYIQNNRPYAERLENGHSAQAPAGVYGITFVGVSDQFT